MSDADRDAQKLLIDIIEDVRPDDGILAEEGASKPARSGITWVIDPLDGTVNFLFGIPIWAVSIAAQDTHGAVAGVIHDPTRNETFAASRGAGATLNGASIHVGDRTELSSALVGTGFAYDARTRAAQASVVARLLPEVRDIRRAGSAALDLASVACGRLDAFYEAHMKLWDKAAGVLLIEEARGTVTDLQDPYGDSHGVVAGNAALHGALRTLVAGR